MILIELFMPKNALACWKYLNIIYFFTLYSTAIIIGFLLEYWLKEIIKDWQTGWLTKKKLCIWLFDWLLLDDQRYSFVRFVHINILKSRWCFYGQKMKWKYIEIIILRLLFLVYCLIVCPSVHSSIRLYVWLYVVSLSVFFK